METTIDSQILRDIRAESRIPRFLDLYCACFQEQERNPCPANQDRIEALNIEFENYLAANPAESETLSKVISQAYPANRFPPISQIRKRILDGETPLIKNLTLILRKDLEALKGYNKFKQDTPLGNKDRPSAMWDVQPGA